eukprot:7912777-Pyramimonas_sp.AAC.1
MIPRIRSTRGKWAMEHQSFVGAKVQVTLHDDQVVGWVRRRGDPIPVDLLTDHVHLGACEAV